MFTSIKRIGIPSIILILTFNLSWAEEKNHPTEPIPQAPQPNPEREALVEEIRIILDAHEGEKLSEIKPKGTTGELKIPGQTKSKKNKPTLAKKLVELGRMSASTNDYEEAENLYIEALYYEMSDLDRQNLLLELAAMYERNGKTAKMIMTYEKFLETYPKHPDKPQILMQLGRLYRDTGAYRTAIERFYDILQISLEIKENQVVEFKKLTQQAQLEIADTYFINKEYDNALKLFSRLKLMDLSNRERERISFKSTYAYYHTEQYIEVINSVDQFFKDYPDSDFVAETQYILANAHKKMGQTEAAVNEVLKLLKHKTAKNKYDEEIWRYWKKRTANQLANEFYEQGDYIGALKIYQTMATLGKTPKWQWPIIYQIGRCFERLQRLKKAAEAYELIVSGKQWDNIQFEESDTLKAIKKNAKWRLDHINWLRSAESRIEKIILPETKQKRS